MDCAAALLMEKLGATYNEDVNKMSKQSEAKEKQNYCAKPAPRSCANCKHLTHDFYHFDENYVRVEGKNPDTRKYARPTYSENLRCGIGGFAVKKTATCDRWNEGA